MIIPRADHCISRANISENALKVLYRLSQAGFEAYLVGGGVRDLLLGREPKDFDVVTNARPDEIRGVFRNCRLIGRRFRLAHIHFGREIIETATFRRLHEEEEGEGDRVVENGQILRDNVYGDSLEEDALRRDFTINALYYDIRDFSVVDFAGGMADIEAGHLRLMGDPEHRYKEDPVRMLRAVRFAVKLGFRIEEQTERPLFELGHLLEGIPSARLYEEVLKLLHGGLALESFEMLRHYGLFGHLFPEVEAVLAEEDEGFPHTFIMKALENTDRRVAEDRPVAPFFLFAALLWEPVRRLTEENVAAGMPDIPALHAASSEVLDNQRAVVAIPKRMKLPILDIWFMQPRFRQRGGGRPYKLLEHPKFRAGYDFLLLRGESGEEVDDLPEWWTRFQEVEGGERREMTAAAVGGEKRPRSRRRRRRAKKPATEG
ncbi:polynucleotide adenylyltransferase PcnB [Endothiovibrio diazotrophicus]